MMKLVFRSWVLPRIKSNVDYTLCIGMIFVVGNAAIAENPSLWYLLMWNFIPLVILTMGLSFCGVLIWASTEDKIADQKVRSWARKAKRFRKVSKSAAEVLVSDKGVWPMAQLWEMWDLLEDMSILYPDPSSEPAGDYLTERTSRASLIREFISMFPGATPQSLWELTFSDISDAPFERPVWFKIVHTYLLSSEEPSLKSTQLFNAARRDKSLKKA